MLQQHFEKIKDSVQSGLNTLQQAVNTQYNTPSFIPATLDLQKPTKSGWLRKAGGVLKGWHRKWFVLKGDYLLYYSSYEDNKQPQGVLFMPGYVVSERNGKSNDAEKYIIDILKDSKSGEGDQVVTESLSIESTEERKVWMKAFKELLYGSLGGAIFGKALEATLQFEKGRNCDRTIPEIVELCVQYLNKHGLAEEGLFRLAGRKKTINRYMEMFDRGFRPQLDGEAALDVHSVASLLKLYLIQLPSSLIPSSHYETVTTLVTRGIPDDAKASMEKLQKRLRSISTHNYTLLKYTCAFLADVSNRQEVNKMTTSNLAVVFSNIFIRPPLESADLMMFTSPARKSVTHLLIDNHSWLFNMEVTPFGGRIVVEDLLGLVVGLPVGAKHNFVVSADCGEDREDDFSQNDGICKSTLDDLQGLDFSVGGSISNGRSGKDGGDDDGGDDGGDNDGDDGINGLIMKYVGVDKEQTLIMIDADDADDDADDDDDDDGVMMRNENNDDNDDHNDDEATDYNQAVGSNADEDNDDDEDDNKDDDDKEDGDNDDGDNDDGDVVFRSRGVVDEGQQIRRMGLNEHEFPSVMLGFNRNSRKRVNRH